MGQVGAAGGVEVAQEGKRWPQNAPATKGTNEWRREVRRIETENGSGHATTRLAECCNFQSETSRLGKVQKQFLSMH